MKGFFRAILDAWSGNSPSAQRMDVHDLHAALQSNPDLVVVDVRTAVEYAAGHVPNAINVPLARINNAPELAELTDQTVHLICLSGARSGRAQGFLASNPFTTINITGGTGAWRRAGYPLVE